MKRRDNQDLGSPLWVSDTGPSADEGQRPLTSLVVIFALIALIIGSFAVLTRSDPGNDTPAALAVPTAPATVADRIPSQGSVAMAMLTELPPISLVVTRHNGEPPMRVDVDEEVRVDVTALAGLRSFAVDASGTWLAALSYSSQLGRIRTLWVGPVAGELAPVAVDVRGFAWHDTRPGQLAFGARPAGGAVHSLFALHLSHVRPRPIEIAESSGWVQDWGDWGFVVRSSGTGSSFDVLDPDGRIWLEQQRGLSAGVIPDVGLLVTSWGSQSKPVVIDLENGESGPLASLGDAQHVWNLAVGGLDGTFAVQTTNFDNKEHEVRVIAADGDLLAGIPAVGGTAAMTWTDDGSTLLFMREDRSSHTELVMYDATTGLVDAIAFEQLNAAEHWTRTIAVDAP